MRSPRSTILIAKGVPREPRLNIAATMKQSWKFTLVVLVGLSLGAGLDETLHIIRDRKAGTNPVSDETFQQRLQCKRLADDYVQKNSDDNTSVFLERVEYSPARRSCIAAVTRAKSGNRITLYEFGAVDLLTAETLFSGECDENDANSRIFCGNGRNMQLIDKRDKTLEAALTSKD
jgi:hypothetical protein